MSTRRSPGRPRGSGKDDSPHLAKIADVLVNEPHTSPTAAIRRVYRASPPPHQTEDTFKRRLQGKWASGAEQLMREAKARATPPPAVRASSSGGYPHSATVYGPLHDLARQARYAVDNLNAWGGQNRVASIVSEARRALDHYQDGVRMAQMNLENQARELDRAMRQARDMQMTVQRFNQDNLLARYIRDPQAVERHFREVQGLIGQPMSMRDILGR